MNDLFGHQTIKALSWKEPYASLMLYDKIETRTRGTNVRGLVLICASKKPYTELELLDISGEIQTQRILNTLNSNAIKETPGYAIAVGELINSRLMQPRDEDKCFVKYYPSLYCWVFKDVRAIEPFPYKGSQGWSNVPQEIINKIKYI